MVALSRARVPVALSGVAQIRLLVVRRVFERSRREREDESLEQQEHALGVERVALRIEPEVTHSGVARWANRELHLRINTMHCIKIFFKVLCSWSISISSREENRRRIIHLSRDYDVLVRRLLEKRVGLRGGQERLARSRPVAVAARHDRRYAPEAEVALCIRRASKLLFCSLFPVSEVTISSISDINLYVSASHTCARNIRRFVSLEISCTQYSTVYNFIWNTVRR